MGFGGGGSADFIFMGARIFLKFALSKFSVVAFPMKTSVLSDFPLCPQSLPPQNREFYFYCRLAVSERPFPEPEIAQDFDQTFASRIPVGKIQRGAHKRGLKPQIFRENRGEILPGKSGLFGANWRHFRAGRGLIRGRSGPIPLHPTATGEEQKLPRKGPFWPDWPLSG